MFVTDASDAAVGMLILQRLLLQVIGVSESVIELDVWVAHNCLQRLRIQSRLLALEKSFKVEDVHPLII